MTDTGDSEAAAPVTPGISPGRRLWLYGLALIFAAAVCVTVPLAFWPWIEARQTGYEPIGTVTVNTAEGPRTIHAFGPGPGVTKAPSYEARLWTRSGLRWRCVDYPVPTKRVFFLLRSDGAAVLVTGEPNPAHPSATTFTVDNGEATACYGSIGGDR